MGNFEERVTELVRTVVDPEVRAVWDALLDRPENNKAALDAILEKLNSVADWMPRIKSEVKDIQDTLRAQEKKKEDKTNQPDKVQRLEKKKEKVKELLKQYADRLADDLLPDAMQKWLQPLTGDKYMKDYGDGGVDIIENMIDNTITNIPLIVAIRTAMEALTTRIGVMDAILKHGISELNKKLGDIETQYLDGMKETIERIEMLQDADHNNIIRIDRGIDDIKDQLNSCCTEMTEQLGSIADTLSQCCQNMSQTLGNLADSVSSIDNHLSGSTDAIMSKLDSLDTSQSKILSCITNSAPRRLP